MPTNVHGLGPTLFFRQGPLRGCVVAWFGKLERAENPLRLLRDVELTNDNDSRSEVAE